MLSRVWDITIGPEDFAAYLYGVLAHGGFTAEFRQELVSRELRVPITKDPDLFQRMRTLGSRLLWLHTYGERFADRNNARRRLAGNARCVKAIPGTPDSYPESFRYEESALTLEVGQGQVPPGRAGGMGVRCLRLPPWCGHGSGTGCGRGAGKKSSPLDEIRPESWPSAFTTELLQLLWLLEETVEQSPQHKRLLSEIVAGDCFQAEELPSVPAAARLAPPVVRRGTQFPTE